MKLNLNAQFLRFCVLSHRPFTWTLGYYWRSFGFLLPPPTHPTESARQAGTCFGGCTDVFGWEGRLVGVFGKFLIISQKWALSPTWQSYIFLSSILYTICQDLNILCLCFSFKPPLLPCHPLFSFYCSEKINHRKTSTSSYHPIYLT